MLAGWKLDLNRILHIFNVRSVVSTWTLLIIPFQTELVMNVHVAVSGIRQDVSKMLMVAQAQTRSAASTIKGSSTLHLYLALGSRPRRRQGPFLDVKS